jgi:hypothetical protein
MYKKHKAGTAINEDNDSLKENKTNITEKIRKFAYSLFEKRRYVHGNDKQDWLEAEKMVHDHKTVGGWVQPYK